MLIFHCQDELQLEVLLDHYPKGMFVHHVRHLRVQGAPGRRGMPPGAVDEMDRGTL